MNTDHVLTTVRCPNVLDIVYYTVLEMRVKKAGETLSG